MNTQDLGTHSTPVTKSSKYLIIERFHRILSLLLITKDDSKGSVVEWEFR